MDGGVRVLYVYISENLDKFCVKYIRKTLYIQFVS